MTSRVGANRGCLLVGEYVDESKSLVEPAIPVGEVVRPHVIVSYLDVWGENEEIEEIAALLKAPVAPPSQEGQAS